MNLTALISVPRRILNLLHRARRSAALGEGSVGGLLLVALRDKLRSRLARRKQRAIEAQLSAEELERSCLAARLRAFAQARALDPSVDPRLLLEAYERGRERQVRIVGSGQRARQIQAMLAGAQQHGAANAAPASAEADTSPDLSAALASRPRAIFVITADAHGTDIHNAGYQTTRFGDVLVLHRENHG